MSFLHRILAPKLYAVINLNKSPYRRNTLEIASDWYLDPAFALFKFVVAFWPLTIIAFWRVGVLRSLASACYSQAPAIVVLTGIMVASRGLGRTINTEYNEFYELFCRSLTDRETRKKLLASYDFSMSKLPPSQIIDTKERHDDQKAAYQSYACRVLLRCLHPIVIRLTYPGIILSYFVGPLIKSGRLNLLRETNAKRDWIRVEDNLIDLVLVDRRSQECSKLIITCEGNGSFLEDGCFYSFTSLNGYSVLGWNRPQYGESLGHLTVDNERICAKAVLSYALSMFNASDIVLYGWSIGGFSALCMAEECTVNRVIVDASFDNVLPLARAMIPLYQPVVKWIVEGLINLDNTELIRRCNSRVNIIRRTHDEIVSTLPGVISHNRGNYLFLDLMKYRYPSIMNERTLAFLQNFITLSKTLQEDVVAQLPKPVELYASIESSLLGDSWPTDIETSACSQSELNAASIMLYRVYMHDIPATHCEQVSPSVLVEPV